MQLAENHLRVDPRLDDVTGSIIEHVRHRTAGQEAILDWSGVRRVYPNFAVPVAATLDFLQNAGHRVSSLNIGDEVEKSRLLAPAVASTGERLSRPVTHTVWKYRTESEAGLLARTFVDVLANKIPCEVGVLDSLNWCLYEVMDNVFQHSHADCGYVMMQLHYSTRHCAIAVTDNGIGIHRSMYDSYKTTGKPSWSLITTAEGAIQYSIMQGATSKAGKNQGNGLFGLVRAVELNGGQITITSGRGRWQSPIEAVAVTTGPRTLLDKEMHQGTTIDWQLDCSTPVSIGEALGVPSYHPTSIVDDLEDEYGEYRIRVSELEDRLGSRAQGGEIRLLLANYVRAGARNIVLDFSGVHIVSSSFADEVLGKLAFEMGELEFRRRVRLERVRPTVLAIVERAISLRLSAPAEIVTAPDVVNAEA